MFLKQISLNVGVDCSKNHEVSNLNSNFGRLGSIFRQV